MNIVKEQEPIWVIYSNENIIVVHKAKKRLDYVKLSCLNSPRTDM